MPDLSLALPSQELEEAFLRVVDPTGKMTAALEALGPVAGREVAVLGPRSGFRARQLEEIGAAVSCYSEIGDAPPASADVVVEYWWAMQGPTSREVAEADRIVRPGGRVLLVNDYGRDDVCQLWPEAFRRQVEWSQRNGPYLGAGFRIRVIHCYWVFDSIEEAGQLLGAAFGEPGLELAGRMKRPRLEYNIAVYHRTAPDDPVSATL